MLLLRQRAAGLHNRQLRPLIRGHPRRHCGLHSTYVVCPSLRLRRLLGLCKRRLLLRFPNVLAQSAGALLLRLAPQRLLRHLFFQAAKRREARDCKIL
ncbi:hypothetical protein, conserved [Leishmania tarentolae]|uniref:Uncharacterized protein n=1 Tax=Leishmania tarentolae TaxID=5689 RepID=A0A640KKX8_LEITA|nr:hypothetical protein, conserved [Leishmania tarentolae]